MQESNTFAPGVCRWSDFTVALDEAADAHTRGTNSELGGAIAELREAGIEPEPLLFAWAMPSAPVDHASFLRLQRTLVSRLADQQWDAVVLAMHGAMATTEEPDADGLMVAEVRQTIGGVPLIVCLDLHANVTQRMITAATATIGYHTDPHVDQAATGRRAARLAIDMLATGTRPTTALAKRPMIVPAESMNTTTGPLGAVRKRIAATATDSELDVSLFPVQPWLDVPELGFGVLVTTDDDQRLARSRAEEIADDVFERRASFTVARLMTPADAIDAARTAHTRPLIVAHSADAPTAGAAGDDPAMIHAALEHGSDLRVVVPIVDPAAVALAHDRGVGASLSTQVGGGIDPRWTEPAPLTATVEILGEGPYRLIGASYTGMEVSMGRYAVLVSGSLRVLASELPPWSADPATFLHTGIDPADADVLVVRSCSDFRPNYPTSDEAVTLDVPGPATPNLSSLRFRRAPRPLWPLDSP